MFAFDPRIDTPTLIKRHAEHQTRTHLIARARFTAVAGTEHLGVERGIALGTDRRQPRIRSRHLRFQHFHLGIARKHPGQQGFIFGHRTRIGRQCGFGKFGRQRAGAMHGVCKALPCRTHALLAGVTALANVLVAGLLGKQLREAQFSHLMTIPHVVERDVGHRHELIVRGEAHIRQQHIEIAHHDVDAPQAVDIHQRGLTRGDFLLRRFDGAPAATEVEQRFARNDAADVVGLPVAVRLTPPAQGAIEEQTEILAARCLFEIGACNRQIALRDAAIRVRRRHAGKRFLQCQTLGERRRRQRPREQNTQCAALHLPCLYFANGWLA